MKKTILGLFFVIFSLQTSANICDSFKEELPLQAGGRVKPLFVLAKESVKFLTGKSKYNNEPQVVTFCKLTLIDQYPEYKNIPLLVEHIESKELVGLPIDEKFMSADKLLLKKDLIRSEIMKQKQSTPFKKDLNKLYSRVDTYEKIITKKTQMFFSTETKTWVSLNEISSLTNETLPTVLKNNMKDYIESEGDHYLLELTYVKSHVYSWALLLCIIGIILTVLLKSMKLGISFALATIFLEIAGMTMRILVSGRAPVTNMYETVMFSGFGALVISLGILYIRRDKVFLLAGFGYNILCLFMMMFANNMLSSSISPLVPVLRDNFWLSTHVTTIILSYAALALSWMVANITIFKMLAKKLTKKEYRYYQDLTYTCIKVGIVLLAIGIILGGVWADYSWGRFWGWDPKETWSLIVLLFYIIIVHGRYTSWLTTHRFILMSAGGFMTVMMAWFGVNYILASGLHSYGFSEGGAIFLGTFFAIQTVILIIAYKQRHKEI